MTIDWITVSAQIVNFLILVWLLKHFLYQPVINAMDEREKRIADRLDDAREREREARKETEHFREKSAELEQKREAILTNAKNEADQQKTRQLDKARAEIDETRGNWQRQLEQEKQEFLGDLRRRSSEAIQAISKKVLGDLADSGLEARMIEKFLERLPELDRQSRKKIGDSSESLRVVSSFELDSLVRDKLTTAIHEQLAEDIEVEYRQSPDLLCGIEITGAGQQLGWNLDDYLDELSARVEDAFGSRKAGVPEN